MKIVVVEPDADLCELVAMVIDEGNHVRCFGSAHEALGSLAMDPADVVLADLDLPDMTGNSFARRLKLLNAATRIVLTSSDWSWLEGMSLDGVAFLRQPFSPTELLSHLVGAEGR